jgi:threonine synthase
MTAAWNKRIICTYCSQPYPDIGVPYCCPECGGIYDFIGPPVLDTHQIAHNLPGMWRFRAFFELPPGARLISLGEGGTPLVPVQVDGQMVYLKLESLNPTGSYKDRGSAVLLSQLVARGVERAVEDSSGNAGASFAAYAARAGVGARVFVPESASGPKRGQIEAYGAELMRIPGPRSAAAESVLKEVQRGVVYASHAYLPFGLPGIATIAYELWEQMEDGEIGSVIAPVGHGGLFLGLIRGFQALLQAGMIDHLPYFVGVQAAACSPVCEGYIHGLKAIGTASEGSTVAEGVRVRRPVRAAAILKFLQQDFPGSGEMLAIPEDQILPAYQDLAQRGIHVEPTSALAWAGYTKLLNKLPGPAALILSGAGLKYQPTM